MLMPNHDEQTRYAKRLAAAFTEALHQATDGNQVANQIVVKVGMRQKDSLLYVALESTDSRIVSQTLLPQLRQILTQLKTKLALEWVKLVKVSGRLPAETTPLWQEDLLLTTEAHIAKTLMRPVPTTAAVAAPLTTAQGLASQQAGDVSIKVGGNFSGNLVVGDGNQIHDYTYNVAHGGILNVASAPTIRPRSGPLAITPRPLARLLDRTTVLPILRQSLSQKSPVELYAEPGFGKTALMQHISHEVETVRGFTDGIVYLPVGSQPAADLLQSLYDLFYEATPPFKPSYGQVQQALQTKDALVIFDGLALDKAQGEWLFTALRDSAFILVSPSNKRIYWQEGEGIALKGLPFPESTALIQIELGRALFEPEKAAARELWAAVAGNPLQLRRIAAQVKEKEQSLVAFAQRVRAVPGGDTQFVPAAPRSETVEQAVFQQVATTLTPKQKKILALMGAMGGVALSAEQSLAIAQIPDASQTISELSQLHLLQQTTNSHYQLSTDLLEIVPQQMNPQPWLSQATEYFTQQAASTAEPGSAEAMMHLLEWTQSTQQWQSSLNLARQLDPALSLSGQWEQWHQVLTAGLQAAEQVGDEAAIGWAQHQLGTHALALGEPTQAASLLSQALQRREQLGDFAGAAVSRHNLGLIVPPLVAGGGGLAGESSSQQSSQQSPQQSPRGGTTPTLAQRRPLGGIAAIAGIILGGSIATGLAVLKPWRPPPAGEVSLSENVVDFGARSLNSASDPRGIVLTNSGKQPIQLGDISLSERGDFRFAPTSTCQVELVLAAGETCELLAIFTPSGEGDRTAKITLNIGASGTRSAASFLETISLTGEGKAAPLPSLNFGTALLDFGEVVLGQAAERTVTITNDGDAFLEIATIATTGSNRNQEYTVVSETCTEVVLLPNSDCTVVLSFQPSSADERTGKFQVESNVGSDRELSLIGIGKAASDKPAPEREETETSQSTPEPAPEPEPTPEPTPTPEPEAPPDAENDSATVEAAGSVVIDVLQNDGEDAQLFQVAPGSIGSTEIQNGKIVYTHTGEGTDRDSFTYTVRNNDGQTAEATVSVQIEASSAPSPVANDDEGFVPVGESTFIDVLSNDSENVTIIRVSQGQFGGTEIIDGGIVYSHYEEGTSDSFRYAIQDSAGATASATVTISVDVPLRQERPEANSDRATVVQGGSVTIDVLANDTDPAGGGLRIVDISAGFTGGQTIIEGDQIIYYPPANGSGDEFIYVIEDSAGEIAETTVSIEIEPQEEITETLQRR